MIDQEIQDWKDKIDGMSHFEMCRYVRFAPCGHPLFDKTLPLAEYFRAKYEEYGGMTPAISKELGWG